MDETDRYEEDYGAIGSLIGPGSHLEGDRLNELLALISMELMRRATKAGLEDEGARALRQVLLLWMRKLHSTPYNPKRLEFFVSEFSDPDRANCSASACRWSKRTGGRGRSWWTSPRGSRTPMIS